MQRVQIVIDQHLLDRARTAAARSGESVSSVVRQALAAWLARQPPDLSWIGSVPVRRPEASDRWDDIRQSIARGMAGRSVAGPEDR